MGSSSKTSILSIKKPDVDLTPGFFALAGTRLTLGNRQFHTDEDVVRVFNLIFVGFVDLFPL
jgi:hypothetical protein